MGGIPWGLIRLPIILVHSQCTCRVTNVDFDYKDEDNKMEIISSKSKIYVSEEGWCDSGKIINQPKFSTVKFSPFYANGEIGEILPPPVTVSSVNGQQLCRSS